MTELYVVTPLANEAVLNPDGTYAAAGENAKARMKCAAESAWEARRKSGIEVVFAYGAGSAGAARKGRTLAAAGADYFRQIEPELPILVNEKQGEVFGTLEEMRWVIIVTQLLFPGVKIRYVFVSQRRHLWRMRVIKWLFFPLTPMQFVVSPQTKEIPWVHEARAYGGLVFHRLGLGKFVRWVRQQLTLQFDRE